MAKGRSRNSIFLKFEVSTAEAIPRLQPRCKYRDNDGINSPAKTRTAPTQRNAGAPAFQVNEGSSNLFGGSRTNGTFKVYLVVVVCNWNATI